MIRTLLTLAAAALLCAGAPTARADAIERFINDGWRVPLRSCELPTKCGGAKPLRSSRWQGETSNDNRIDRRTLFFDGLTVEFLYLLGNASMSAEWNAAKRADRTPRVLHVEVTSARWAVVEGLTIGAPRKAVEAKLGPGAAAQGDRCASYASSATQNEAVLCYTRGRLASIAWTQWWDG